MSAYIKLTNLKNVPLCQSLGFSIFSDYLVISDQKMFIKICSLHMHMHMHTSKEKHLHSWTFQSSMLIFSEMHFRIIKSEIKPVILQ